MDNRKKLARQIQAILVSDYSHAGKYMHALAIMALSAEAPTTSSIKRTIGGVEFTRELALKIVTKAFQEVLDERADKKAKREAP